MTSNETKNFCQSKTIIGAVAMIIPILSQAFGIEIGSEEATTAAEAIMGLAGFILAIVGRVQAKQGLALGKGDSQ